MNSFKYHSSPTRMRRRVFAALFAAVAEGILIGLLLIGGQEAAPPRRSSGFDDDGVNSFALGEAKMADALQTQNAAPDGQTKRNSVPRSVGEKAIKIEPNTPIVEKKSVEQTGTDGQSRVPANEKEADAASSFHESGVAQSQSASGGGNDNVGGDAFNPYATAATSYLPDTRADPNCVQGKFDDVNSMPQSALVAAAPLTNAPIANSDDPIFLSANDMAALRKRIVAAVPDVCGTANILVRVDVGGTIIDAQASGISSRRASGDSREPVNVRREEFATSPVTPDTSEEQMVQRVRLAIIGASLTVKGDPQRWCRLPRLID